jgi:hypothetical protein
MRRIALLVTVLVLFGGCTLGWRDTSGPRVMEPATAPGAAPDEVATPAPTASPAAPSRRVSVVIPGGWEWSPRGDDLMTSRDGPFLQHILVERFHVNQKSQNISGAFPLAAYAAKLWPLRTVRHLKVPIVEGMKPITVGEGIMDSRRTDPAAEGMRVLGLRPAPIAGSPGFCADYEFRLAPVENRDGSFQVNYRWPPPLDAVQQRKPAYRGRYCGVLLGQWVYGFVYEAPAREYFVRDLATYDRFLASVKIFQ